MKAYEKMGFEEKNEPLRKLLEVFNQIPTIFHFDIDVDHVLDQYCLDL